jgi:hypothetical protein
MPAALNSIVYRPIDVWPGELTRSRKPSQFSAEFRATLRLLSDEVDHLTDPKFDTLIVVQLAVDEGQIRKDETGLLAHAQTQHPGVIVSFEADQGPLRFSCDRFSDGWNRKAGWRDNLRAVALALEALRKIDRYGIGSGREQYVGFNALPPGQPMAMGAAMTIEEAARLLAECSVPNATGDDARVRYLSDRLLAGEGIQLAYRVAAKHHHPDAGGDAELFRRLTEARDLLLQ